MHRFTGDEQEHSWLFNPGGSIPPEVIKISHITDDMVKDAPPFAQIAPAIRDSAGRLLHPLAVAGLLTGLGVMYLTGLMVSL